MTVDGSAAPAGTAATVHGRGSGSPLRLAFCPQPPFLLDGLSGQVPPPEAGPVHAAAQAAIGWLVSGADSVVVLAPGDHVVRRSTGAVGSTRELGVDWSLRLGRAAAGPDTDPDPSMPTGLLVAAQLLLPYDVDVTSWTVPPDLSPTEVDRLTTDVTSWTAPPDLSPTEVDRLTADVASWTVPPDLSPREVDRLTADVGRACGPVLVMGDGSARRRDGAPGHLDPRGVPFDDRAAEILGAGDVAALAALDLGLADELLAAGPPVWRVAARLCGDEPLAGAGLDHYDAPYGVGYLVARWWR